VLFDIIIIEKTNKQKKHNQQDTVIALSPSPGRLRLATTTSLPLLSNINRFPLFA
jgi:hypothetical protein